MQQSTIKGIFIGAGAAMALVAGAWFATESRPPEQRDYVARIGLETISVNEFREEMARRGGHIPGQFRTVEQRQALLDAMIERRLLLAGAKSAGYHQDPEVRRAIEKFMIDKFRADALKQRLDAVSVTDEDARAYYEQNVERYSTPAQRRAAIIELTLSPRASEAYKEKIYGRIEDVMQGVSELPEGVNHFGMLARRFSEDRSSRYQGGVIGWLEKDPNHPYKWGDEVLKTVWQLENEGDVSQPIQVEDKLYLVRLVELKDKEYRPYERVSAGIRQLLTRQRKERVKDEFLADIQNTVPVELNQLALEAMGPVSGPKADREVRPPAVPGTGRP